MRTLLLAGLFFTIFGLHAQAPDHSAWTQLLKKHVSADGKVHYPGFVQDKKWLENYLSLLSKQSPASNWSKEERLAFWINAYNAFTVKLIADHYPVKSIKDLNPLIAIPGINTVWQERFFTIGGKAVSLDDIEHTILRKQFNEPRIHFAINCASVSCPVLLNEAYTPQKLESQLQQQTVRFINDPLRNKITETHVQLSQVFNWFTSDFTKHSTLIGFVNRFTSIKIREEAKVSFLPYDWSLND